MATPVLKAVPQPAPEGNQLSVEDSFRATLEDVLLVIDKAGPHCPDVSALRGVVALGLKDEGQLKFLLSLVTSK